MAGRHRQRIKKRKKQGYNSGLKGLLRDCINCGEKGPHFIGPSFGDLGFWACEEKEVKNVIRYRRAH